MNDYIPDPNDPTYWNDHHLLPMQFEDNFRAAGVDPNDFAVTMYAFQHQGIHPDWNADWHDFFHVADVAGYQPTPDDVHRHMTDMMTDYGFNNYEIHPYQDPHWYDPHG